VLKEARTEKLVVMAGPVLAEEGREFHGRDDQGRTKVRIPTAYWKVVVARAGNRLETFAFVLEQDLSRTQFTEGVEFAAGAWSTSMEALDTLEEMVRFFRFDRVLHDSDQIAAPDGEAVREITGIQVRGAGQAL
jgi:endonuclease G, mitochondrial